MIHHFTLKGLLSGIQKKSAISKSLVTPLRHKLCGYNVVINIIQVTELICITIEIR